MKALAGIFMVLLGCFVEYLCHCDIQESLGLLDTERDLLFNLSLIYFFGGLVLVSLGAIVIEHAFFGDRYE